MKPTLVLALSLLTAATATASADPLFYNVTTKPFTIEVTLPNGAKDTRKISPNTPGIDSEAFVLGAGVKAVKVALLDEAGATAWSGTVKRDDTYLFTEGKDGSVKAIYSGEYGGDPMTTALVIMNVSGEDLVIDLEGHNGVGAKRGIVPGASFDVKKPVKLAANEVTYNVLGKTKAGAAVKIEGTLKPGKYALIWKDQPGVIRATTLGTLAVPKRKK